MCLDAKNYNKQLVWKRLCPSCGGDILFSSDKGMLYMYCKKCMMDILMTYLLPAFEEEDFV